VATKFILAALALVFLGLGLSRVARSDPGSRSQGRTWLSIGFIFGAVSAWLFLQE
jgi:hypothetical protein